MILHSPYEGPSSRVLADLANAVGDSIDRIQVAIVRAHLEGHK